MKTKNKILFLPVICFSVFIIALEAQAATYYVATTGDDSTGNGSSAAPWKTIQKCADAASSPGDTCIIGNGTYTIASTGGTAYIATVKYSGTSSSYITFKSATKWGAVLDGGFKPGVAGLNLYKRAYVKVEDFEIKNTAGVGAGNATGINFASSNHIILKGNLIHDIGRRPTNTTIGQSCTGASDNASYITYDSNVMYNCGRLTYYTTPQAVPGGTLAQNDATCTMAYNQTIGSYTCPNTNGCNNCYNHDHGMYVAGDHYTIINNLVYGDISGWAVQVDGGDSLYPALHWDIINNTFAGINGGRKGQIVLWGGADDFDIQNNISYDPNYLLEPCCGTSPQDNHSNIRIINNLQYPGTALVNPANFSASSYILSNNFTGQNPKFMNLPNYDFHLQTGSPAIGKGLLTNAPTYDLDGKARGNSIDIGAFEYAGTVTDTVPPAAPSGLRIQ